MIRTGKVHTVKSGNLEDFAIRTKSSWIRIVPRPVASASVSAYSPAVILTFVGCLLKFTFEAQESSQKVVKF